MIYEKQETCHETEKKDPASYILQVGQWRITFNNNSNKNNTANCAIIYITLKRIKLLAPKPFNNNF